MQGMIYAVVPQPWLEEWMHWVADRGGGRFQWWLCCGAKGRNWYVSDTTKEYDYGKPPMDDEGNIILCLLEHGHEGDCGPVRAGLALRP